MNETAKTLATVLLVLALGGTSALAEVIQCRHIQSRKDRDACYAKQEAAKHTRSEASNPKMIDAVEQMKIDDDRLTKRLQGICRGC